MIIAVVVGAITAPNVTITNNRNLIVNEKNQASAYSTEITNVTMTWEKCKNGDVITIVPNTIVGFNIYGIN